FWRYSLTSFLRKTLHRQSQCCNKRVLSRLFLWLLPTRLGVTLLAVWRGRAATLLVPVRQQPTQFRKKTPWIDGRQTVASSQQDKLLAMNIKEAVRHRDQTSIGRLSGYNGFEFGPAVNGSGYCLHPKERCRPGRAGAHQIRAGDQS